MMRQRRLPVLAAGTALVLAVAAAGLFLTRQQAHQTLAQAGDPAAQRAAVARLLHTGGSLAGLDLSGADLSRLDLEDRSLRGTRLRAARLWGTRLAGADLSAADLAGADATGADLAGVVLRDAHVSRLDLGGSLVVRNLDPAALAGAWAWADRVPEGLDPAVLRLCPPDARPAWEDAHACAEGRCAAPFVPPTTCPAAGE